MRLTVPEQKKLVHETTFPIRWGDMDAAGHVNNTLYFRYFEIVRIAWLDSLGCTPYADGKGPVLANTFCNFLRPMEYPGEILARQYVAHAGRTSFDAFITLERTDQPGVLYADGGATTVWFDFAAQKPTALPQWLRAALA